MLNVRLEVTPEKSRVSCRSSRFGDRIGPPGVRELEGVGPAAAFEGVGPSPGRDDVVPAAGNDHVVRRAACDSVSLPEPPVMSWMFLTPVMPVAAAWVV